MKSDYELQTQIFFVSLLCESGSLISEEFNSQVDFDLAALSLVHSCAFLMLRSAGFAVVSYLLTQVWGEKKKLVMYNEEMYNTCHVNQPLIPREKE